MFYLFPPNFYAFEGLWVWGSSLLFNFLEVLSSCFARLFAQPSISFDITKIIHYFYISKFYIYI